MESHSLVALQDSNNLQHKVLALLENEKHGLVKPAEIYMMADVAGKSSETIAAKKCDLQLFFDFYESVHGNLDPSLWFASTTEAFIKYLANDTDPVPPHPPFSQATIARTYSSVRRLARWLHQHVKPFALGCPTDGVKPPAEPKPDWQGLTPIEELRLATAGQILMARPGRGTNQGSRDYAAVAALQGSGLRISELFSRDLHHYNGKGFTGVRRKGGDKDDFVPLKKESRRILNQWIKERGNWPGPLFPTRSGKRLGRSQFFKILKRMANQANANVPDDEKTTLSPHTLRHTFLRKLAEEKGLQYAMEASGHKTGRYIWRYVNPGKKKLA